MVSVMKWIIHERCIGVLLTGTPAHHHHPTARPQRGELKLMKPERGNEQSADLLFPLGRRQGTETGLSSLLLYLDWGTEMRSTVVRLYREQKQGCLPCYST